MKLRLCLAIAALLCVHAFAFANDANGTIMGKVDFDTKAYKLHAKLVYSLTVPDTSATMRFYLASDANLHSVHGRGLKNFYVDTASKPERSIVLNFERPSMKADIHFEYDLPFDSANFNEHGYIELGLDWFWFPIHPNFSGWKVRFDLNVSIDQEGIDLFSNGQVKRSDKTTFIAKSIYPEFDINLFFLKNARVYPSGPVKVIGNEKDSPLKDSIAVTTSQYLSHYKNWLGENAAKVTCVFRPVVDANGFGYSRKGYFVLPEPTSLSSIKFYVAHELAHFWFLYGEPKENSWLTESMAEYAAMLLIKTLDGDSAFNLLVQDKISRLARFTKDGKVIPAVYKNGSVNKTMWSQVALYHKGPLLLDELRKKIGDEKIMKLLKQVAETKINTTEQFLDLLESVTDRPTREFMFERLKS